MKTQLAEEISGALLDECYELTLSELCRACELPAEEVLALVEEGVIEPLGQGRTQWRFSGICVRRVRRVRNLKRDLGVNLPGAALAIELLEEIEHLQAQLRRFEEQL
ncbi:chaperone modulator CbpM [Microbulbifer rhizosphaerae]|uniref:Chaperone modulatory protein CbpM n=1 Tax=Microbulbifer rhizosphaerae TaxID=1562603 RepID=A0A7W4WCB1_9GAMM|nr:chaperone modulator CbpM [Microbulbifer rhizosphaerae]MBB3061103.1 chaperone modulatory protein CbpM [Microbulbifer rhizosphaerae]